MLDEDLRVNVPVFWVVTLRVLIGRYRRFERESCFHLQGRVVSYRHIRYAR
jgi:hypothetical protein